VSAAQLLDVHVPDGHVTEGGVRNNVSVALQYLDAWLAGTGAVAIFNLMEDAATSEIARSQLWQWRRHGARLDDGRAVTDELYGQLRDEELARLGTGADHLAEARAILDRLVLDEAFAEFMTLSAYPRLP